MVKFGQGPKWDAANVVRQPVFSSAQQPVEFLIYMLHYDERDLMTYSVQQTSNAALNLATKNKLSLPKCLCESCSYLDSDTIKLLQESHQTGDHHHLLVSSMLNIRWFWILRTIISNWVKVYNLHKCAFALNSISWLLQATSNTFGGMQVNKMTRSVATLIHLLFLCVPPHH